MFCIIIKVWSCSVHKRYKIITRASLCNMYKQRVFYGEMHFQRLKYEMYNYRMQFCLFYSFNQGGFLNNFIEVSYNTSYSHCNCPCAESPAALWLMKNNKSWKVFQVQPRERVRGEGVREWVSKRERERQTQPALRLRAPTDRVPAALNVVDCHLYLIIKFSKNRDKG